MRLTTERNRNIISGAVGLLLLIAGITVGIKASFGAFDGGYQLTGTFAAAGQGLIDGSDVKVRGVNVGEVSGIDLVDNRAVVTMRISDGTEIPVAAQAVIRPKTLFGEKFVDLIPGQTESTGPYLADGDEIADTLGGFELEQVLADTYPVLEAVDPAELAIVLDELATSADGLGETVNRSLVNGAAVAELTTSNDAEFRQFTADLALLSEELDALAPDLVAGARDLNVALPSLNARSDQLNSLLVQASRLSSDLADLLENNEAFTTRALTDGSRQLQTLFDNRGQLQPLLLGITRYTQTLSEAVRIEVGDGTLMAAVKLVVNPIELLEDEADQSPVPIPIDADDIGDLVPDVLPEDGLSNPLAPGTGLSTFSRDLLQLLTGGGR